MSEQISSKAVELIAEAEGFDQPGKWPGGGSGVTVGVGYDLGFYAEATFRHDWAGILTDAVLDRLAHALGVTGQAARSYAQRLTDIRIPREGALKVFHNITLPTWRARMLKAFPGADKLPLDAQGALISLVFNRGTAMDGDRRHEMKVIQSIVKDYNNGLCETKRALEAIAAQIRSMKRLWEGKGLDGLLRRRDAEADLVLSSRSNQTNP